MNIERHTYVKIKKSLLKYKGELNKVSSNRHFIDSVYFYKKNLFIPEINIELVDHEFYVLSREYFFRIALAIPELDFINAAIVNEPDPKILDTFIGKEIFLRNISDLAKQDFRESYLNQYEVYGFLSELDGRDISKIKKLINLFFTEYIPNSNYKNSLLIEYDRVTNIIYTKVYIPKFNSLFLSKYQDYLKKINEISSLRSVNGVNWK